MKAAYLSPLRVELLDPYRNDGTGLWSLTEPFVYQSAILRRVVEVPAGFTHDFASVPRAPFVYSVFGNRYHRAAVIHDWLCGLASIERHRADLVFNEAMTLQNAEEVAAMREAGIDEDEVVDRINALSGRTQLMFAAVVSYSKTIGLIKTG